MSKGKLYLLDSSVLIQAARLYYAFDIAPGFWSSLADLCATGRVASIDRVSDEIKRGKDELAAWIATEMPDALLDTTDSDVLQVYGELMNWAFSQTQYTTGAKNEFARADNADAWLVAFAKARDCIIVTQEEPAPQATKVIKLPTVCKDVKVSCCSTFEMLRNLDVQLGSKGHYK